jgi:hypothetical protein
MRWYDGGPPDSMIHGTALSGGPPGGKQAKRELEIASNCNEDAQKD